MTDHVISSSKALYLGFPLMPLIFVEVTPLEIKHQTVDSLSAMQFTPSLSAPSVKLLLRRKTLCSTFSQHASTKMLRENNHTGINSKGGMENSMLLHGSLSFPIEENKDLRYAFLETTRRLVPLEYLKSDDPGDIDPVPCHIVAYGLQTSFESEKIMEAIITDSTLVRILPVESASAVSKWQEFAAPNETSSPHLSSDWKHIMSGESHHPPLSSEMLGEVFHNHDQETIQALTLRMSLLLAQPVSIGTTTDAFVAMRKRQRRETAIRGALDSYVRSKGSNASSHAMKPSGAHHKNDVSSATKVPLSLLREGALIVHSPNHGAGKTLLVQAIAQERLKCQAIHIIQPTSLLAQYGVHADAALESILHSIVMSAACQRKSICIILDHLDAMLPPLLSSRTSAGDAAMPVVKAIGELSDVVSAAQLFALVSHWKEYAVSSL